MSWAEEQDWFGLEDLALEAMYGSDYDLDSTHSDVESISIPAWRMADGNLIAIRDMETSHIKNCIKMIHRKSNTWRPQYLRYFEAELKRRKLLNKPSWEDKEGNKYPIFITKKGACYVLRTSKKTGKEYKYYLPKDILEIPDTEESF